MYLESKIYYGVEDIAPRTRRLHLQLCVCWFRPAKMEDMKEDILGMWF